MNVDEDEMNAFAPFHIPNAYVAKIVGTKVLRVPNTKSMDKKQATGSVVRTNESTSLKTGTHSGSLSCPQACDVS
jgi:hypothetical protein